MAEPGPGTTPDLDGWLDRIQRTHPRDIELGLDRVRLVWTALGAPPLARQVILVGGTNGKGSTVAFIDAIARTHGWRVGRYTSPHVHRFNERIVIDDVPVDDAVLCTVFERIEQARGDVALTFFEFTTLAAFLVFAAAGLDLVVLEVGLGGRLDATNLIDADVAVVTTVDLDHQDWLGHDRETIGREKAGIFRAGRVAVSGERSPPASVLAAAQALPARLCRRGVEFDVSRTEGGWDGRWPGLQFEGLPRPDMPADVQVDNAATAIAALTSLPAPLSLDRDRVIDAIRNARAPARLELRRIDGHPVWFDVGHNPQAAASLARWLAETPIPGKTLAVFSLLADKDLAGVLDPLATLVDQWFVCGLDQETPRGRTGEDLGAAMRSLKPDMRLEVFDRPEGAFAAACRNQRDGDRLIVFGSFHLVDRLRR